MNTACSSHHPLQSVVSAAFALLATALHAGTYFVAPNTTSTDWGAATSMATPCTPSVAMVNAHAGDTVYFLAGQYEIPDSDPRYGRPHYHAFLEPYNSGTPEAPITFAAYPGASVVMNGTVSDSDELVRIFSTSDKDHIVFDGFAIQANGGAKMGSIIIGYDSGTWTKTAIGCVIRNCTFTGGTDIITSTDNRECIRIEWSQDTVVSNCRIAHARQNGDGLVDWHNTSAIKLYHTRNTLLEHCDISDCSEGIYDKSDGSGTVIRYNFIHDNAEGMVFTSFTDGRFSHDNCTAYHNIFAGNKHCLGDVTEALSHSHNLTLRNNTLYCDPASTTAAVAIALNAGTGKRVVNNLVYGKRRSSDLGMLRFYATTAFPCTIAECDYNLFGPSSQFSVRRHAQTGGYFTYSTRAAWQATNALESGAAPDQHSLVAVPLFANGSGTMTAVADFRLLSASPGYRAGSDGKDIGANPGLVGILPRDTVAPAAPTGLAGSSVSPTQIDLVWTTATDNSGVTSYRIYRGSSFLGTSATTAYSDTTAAATTAYAYTVIGCDAAGNVSSPSAAFAIITGHAYYVAPGGRDDNPGTLASPWATPLKAWTAANAGDTVYFRAGTYNVAAQIWTKYFGHDGTAANPIVFRNYPGETATISSNVGTVFVIEKDYNRVEGLNFVGGPATDTWFQVAYDVAATNFTASRCIASMGAGGDNTGFVNLGGGATGAVVEHCRITGPGYSGLHGNTAGLICFRTEGVRFIHNEISSTMIGIYFKFANPQNNPTPGIEIAYNYIHETGRYAMMLNCNHASIHNNVIGAHNAGIEVNESNGVPGGDGNVFAHNTFAGGIGFNLYYDTNGTDTVPGAIANVLRANLFTARVDAHWFSSVPHSTQSDYNLFVAGAQAVGENRVNYSLATWQTHTGGDAHSLAGTPTFVDGTSPSTLAGFSLAANSLGKFAAHDGLDIGANIALVGPQGLVTAPTDTTAPTVPTGLAGTATSATAINLTWTASSDNVSVTGYRIYRNGSQVGTSATATYTDTGRTTGTTYSYQVVAFDAAGNASGLSTAASVVAHDETHTDFADWVAGNFTAAEQANAAISGPTADPSGCGVSNLLRYAYGLPARGRVTSPVTVGIIPDSGHNYLALTFPRKGYAPDLEYIVQSSSDLATWIDLPTVLPGYPKTVTVRDLAPTSGQTRRFLRLRIDHVIPIDDLPGH